MRPKSSSPTALFVSVLSSLAILTPQVIAQGGVAQAVQGLKELIQVTGGSITGTPTIQWGPGVRLYRGFPFAAPPVVDIRWRAPQPVVPWTGVRAADHFRPACAQPPTENS